MVSSAGKLAYVTSQFLAFTVKEKKGNKRVCSYLLSYIRERNTSQSIATLSIQFYRGHLLTAVRSPKLGRKRGNTKKFCWRNTFVHAQFQAELADWLKIRRYGFKSWITLYFCSISWVLLREKRLDINDTVVPLSLFKHFASALTAHGDSTCFYFIPLLVVSCMQEEF